jgi:hypothetical protein
MKSVLCSFLVVVTCLALLAAAPPPSFEQYLMADRSAEISMARSAAPESISGNAEILVLTRRGFETAVKGTNGFVCLVERSWSGYAELEADFFNPKERAPICYNALAARSRVAATIKKAEIVLAGGSRAQVFDAIKAAIENKELPTAELGAMAYMMSKQEHWHPHVMFFAPRTDPKGWGASLPGSPINGNERAAEHLTVFDVFVPKWSDGTPADWGDLAH